MADTAPPELRGTAFGVFNLAAGLALLAASVIAGALWDAHGPSATFLAGAAFTVVALLGYLASQGRSGGRSGADRAPDPSGDAAPDGGAGPS